MKRLLFAFLLSVLFAIGVFAQSPGPTCTVTGYLFNVDQTPAVNLKNASYRIVARPGYTYTTFSRPFTTDSTGQIEVLNQDGTLSQIGFNAPQGSDITIYAPIKPFDGPSGLTVRIPSASGVDINSLASTRLGPVNGVTVIGIADRIGTFASGSGVVFTETSPGVVRLDSLSLSNPMTTLGDTIYGVALGVATRLAGDTSNTRKFLREQAIASVAQAPAWDTLVAGDIPNIAESQVTNLVSDLSGKQAAFGNQSANTVYAGPTTGSAAAPAFRVLVAADIPSIPETKLTFSDITTGNASSSNHGFLPKLSGNSSDVLRGDGTFGLGGGGMGDPGSNGIVVRTALNTTVARSIAVGGSSNLTISNADGTAGNPTIDIIASPTFTAPSITRIGNLTTNGFVKTGSGNGTLSVDTNTYLTGNQSITISGDGSGSGTTAIALTLANNGTARSDIGLGTGNTPQFSALGLGGAGPGSGVAIVEAAVPSGIASSDIVYADSTSHRLSMINNNGSAVQIVAAGVDINSSDQVTATHLSSALPIAQGGSGTGSTLTGLVRGGNPFTASELSGDVTTSGSNATTIKTNVSLAGNPTTTTQSSSDNSTRIATTAFVQGQGYITGNQTITLSGDVSGSGATAITTALGNIPTDVTMAGDLLATNIVAPATPASGKSRIYVDSTSKNLAVKNDAGTVNHGIQTRTSTASNWINAINDDGSTTISQPAFTDISGSIATAQMLALTNGHVYVGNGSNQPVDTAPTGTGTPVFGTGPGLTSPQITTDIRDSSNNPVILIPGGNGQTTTVEGTVAASSIGSGGGGVTLSGQAGTSTGSGGNGGNITVAAGNGSGDNTVSRSGGTVGVTAGNSLGNSVGGVINLTTGNAGDNQTSAATTNSGVAGGDFNLTLGTGGTASLATVASTGGRGGRIVWTLGTGGAATVAGTGNNTGGTGGALSISAGTGGAASGSTSGTNTGGDGGQVALIGGQAGSASNGGTNTPGSGGLAKVQGGSAVSVAGGAGGGVQVLGSNGSGTGSGGAGGGVVITAGNAGGDNTVGRAGGSVAVTAGNSKGNTSGSNWTATTGSAGDNNVNTSAGATGGNFSFAIGGGGTNQNATNQTGGNGGSITWSSGTGGNATSTTGTNNGGIGGGVNMTLGTGGNATGNTSSANTGGAGGPFTVIGGTGGTATTGSGTLAGGTGGGMTIRGGLGGVGTSGGGGGAATLQGGQAAAFAGANAGGLATVQGGTASSTGSGGAGGGVNITGAVAGGDNTAGRTGGAIVVVAGNSKGNTVGALISFTTGNAGDNQVSGSTGANGGSSTYTLGNGGTASTAAAPTGGNGGTFTITGGTGGAASSTSGTNTGGVGSAFNWTAGPGGAANGANSGTDTGGAGGNITLQAGAGGAATTGTTNNGGNGGTLNLEGGVAGSGATANGTAGDVVFLTTTGTSAVAARARFKGSSSNFQLDSGTLITQGSGGSNSTQDVGFWRNSAGVWELNNSTTGQWAALKLGVRDGGTNTIVTGLTLGHQSTGTPAAGNAVAITYNLDSTTTADRNAVRTAGIWTTATDASRTADFVVYNVNNAAALAETFRVTAAGGITTQTGANTFNGASTFNKSVVNTPVVLTDGATVATDASTGNRFRLTLVHTTSARTISNPTNATDGQQITYELIQDGTGGATFSFDTNFAFGTDITGCTATTTASKRDFVTAIYNSTATKWYITGCTHGY